MEENILVNKLAKLKPLPDISVWFSLFMYVSAFFLRETFSVSKLFLS